MNEGCAGVSVSANPGCSKTEEAVQNNDDASSSPGRSSPEANCPICLGKPENKSFTDSCLHQFCFTCLLEWSKVKAECPLCKQSFKSIIHNVRSIEDYEQYYLSTTATEGTLFVSREIFRLESAPSSNYREPSNYRLRTTAVSSYLDYFVRLEEAISHRVIPPGPSISGGTLWQRRRQRGTSDFRRNIYQQGLWVQRTTDVTGRVRECSPEFYRANPAQVHRLVPWLNRELNVLLYENSPHTQHVMSRILELITQVPIRSPGFTAVIAPYIGRHTEHFVHEFHSFATSPFDLVGYDRHTNYYVGRGEIIDFEDNSSDSEVQILEEGIRNSSPLIQLVDSDSDDCIVLDTPMTRPEPEVITLDSDDDDEVVQISIETSQPCTSQASTSVSKPSTSRRPRLKRNWLTVNNVQVPTTSSTCENMNGCEISISIAHSSRDISPSVSETSSASWFPVSKKPTKVKKKSETTRKRKIRKDKTPKSVVILDVTSESDSSSGPVLRGRKPSVALISSPSSKDSDSDRTLKVDDKNPPSPRECKPFVFPSASVDSDSDSDRLYVATDASTSSDESEYKPRLRSVVVKSTVKPKPTVIPPTFSRSESYDYESYSDLHSGSRSRSNSYRSTYSYHGRRSSSSSSERPTKKRCKHYKKRSKREK